jgi:hypothetical protein
MKVLVQCNGQATEAKDQIIGLLAEQFPITAQKLYNLMKKRYLTGLTYHAVYKHLNELAAKKVVIKEGTEYRLSGEWMENTQRFLNGMEANYAAQKLNGASIETVRLLSFKSQTDFYSFIEGVRESFISENKGKEIFWMGNHAWAPLFFMNSTADGIKNAKKNGVNYYICIRGGTALDKTVAEFYKSMGVNFVKFGTGNENSYTIYIYGNELILVDHPLGVSDQIHAVFKRTKSPNDIDLGRLYQNVMQKEQPVHVMVIKNREFVERYKNAIKSYFAD